MVPNFSVGDVISHKELTDAFQCGNMGGMRRSKATGTLVLISDHTKMYDDKWFGDELHYTGMGKKGDQVLVGNQNKTLADSKTNGVEVHLFEVVEPTKYIYQGIVELSAEPYQEQQDGDDGHPRKVWMFPLKRKTANGISQKNYERYVANQRKLADKLSLDELEKRAEEHSRRKSKGSHRNVTTDTYYRDPVIARYAKERAKGICQLCGMPAPFNDKDGNPYLESHHIVWLSEGGEDTIDNTVALCPNCHKRMHVLNEELEVKILQSRIKKR